MTKKKSLKNEVATKGYVLKIVTQATDAILNGMQKMFDAQNKRFDLLESKMDTGHENLQRQITDLKWDTPTRGEFNKLKTRVNRYHPAI